MAITLTGYPEKPPGKKSPPRINNFGVGLEYCEAEVEEHKKAEWIGYFCRPGQKQNRYSTSMH